MLWCCASFAQEKELPSSYEEDDTTEMEAGRYQYELAYSKGTTAMERQRWLSAKRAFANAFRVTPGEDAARAYYYTLIYRGEDLEAGFFLKRNKTHTFSIAAPRKGLETIYFDAGPRFSANNNAGNIYYGSIGALIRTGAASRFWTSVNHVQQDNNLGSYKQYEYFGSLRMAVGKGWSIIPSVGYIYSDINGLVTEQRNVHYTADYVVPNDSIHFRTTGVQNLRYTMPGNAQQAQLSCAIEKTSGAWSLGLEPAFQYSLRRSTTSYTYETNGITDSFSSGALYGTRPFYEKGSGSFADTSVTNYVAQAGLSLAWRPSVAREPISLRLAFYYLFDRFVQTGNAVHFYGSYRWSNNFWMHLNWLYKGSLPVAINYEGQYFNLSNIVRSRAGISFQLLPLRKLSGLLTYQYEEQERSFDHLTLQYHSCYLTIKYSL